MNASDHSFPKIIAGEFIRLQKIELKDAEFIYALRTSSAAKFLNCPEGYSIEMQLLWQRSRTPAEANYIIYDNKDDERVGMASIYECDWANGVSNVGRLLLQSQYVHAGTPYGLEALQLTYGYVFDIMKFRKISGIINSRNEPMVRLQKYLGMVQEGYFGRHVLLHGKPQDLYFLSLFKENFSDYSSKISVLLNKFRK
jgi:RimJ/RimL family protein N-acetyltransferase